MSDNYGTKVKLKDGVATFSVPIKCPTEAEIAAAIAHQVTMASEAILQPGRVMEIAERAMHRFGISGIPICRQIAWTIVGCIQFHIDCGLPQMVDGSLLRTANPDMRGEANHDRRTR